MFYLLSQLSESVSKQRLKTLVLQVQQDCEDKGVTVELTKFGDEDGPTAYFVTRLGAVELRMSLHSPLEWMGEPSGDIAVLAIDWDNTNDYDVEGENVFTPVTAAKVVNAIMISLQSMED